MTLAGLGFDPARLRFGLRTALAARRIGGQRHGLVFNPGTATPAEQFLVQIVSPAGLDGASLNVKRIACSFSVPGIRIFSAPRASILDAGSTTAPDGG